MMQIFWYCNLFIFLLFYFIFSLYIYFVVVMFIFYLFIFLFSLYMCVVNGRSCIPMIKCGRFYDSVTIAEVHSREARTNYRQN